MKTQLKKGFTLVEIMIVVVIIGLLAALAIPAFKKVRNNAIEKSLINDARQISSAAQQFMSENATTYATVGQIGNYLAGNKLSAGVECSQASASAGSFGSQAVAPNGTWSSTSTSIVVQQNEYFTLGHVNYDRALSSNVTIGGSGQSGTTYLTFTETGSLK